MREISVPACYVVAPDDNITDDIFEHAQNVPDTVGFRRKVNGAWVPVTWREFAEQVRGLAAGLVGAGIRPGDRVGLMSRTRFEWPLLDYAILTAGGVTVPIYPTSSLKKFLILDEELTEARGQLTPTMKVRRSVVMEQYAAQIDALYQDRPA